MALPKRPAPVAPPMRGRMSLPAMPVRSTATPPPRTRWRFPSSSAASTDRYPAPPKRPVRHFAPGSQAGAGRRGVSFPQIDHGGSRMNPTAATPPATIRARIHESAVKRVTRTYAATLSEIFIEALQNSRRADATRVRICQSALKFDPRSACNIDPPEWHGGGCPGSQQGGPARLRVAPCATRSEAAWGVPVGPPGQPGRGDGRRRVRSGS